MCFASPANLSPSLILCRLSREEYIFSLFLLLLLWVGDLWVSDSATFGKGMVTPQAYTLGLPRLAHRRSTAFSPLFIEL